MSSQYGELRPTSRWDRFVSLGHSSKCQRVSRLGSVTARHLVVDVSQTLRRWTDGATYIRQSGHHVGHWPTFLVVSVNNTTQSTELCTQHIQFIHVHWRSKHGHLTSYIRFMLNAWLHVRVINFRIIIIKWPLIHQGYDSLSRRAVAAQFVNIITADRTEQCIIISSWLNM